MQKIFRRLSAALLCLALLAAPALAAEATIRSDYVVIEGENFVADTFCGVDALYNETGRTLFCNELVIEDDGHIADYKLRCEQTKLTTVRALHTAFGLDSDSVFEETQLSAEEVAAKMKKGR